MSLPIAAAIGLTLTVTTAAVAPPVISPGDNLVTDGLPPISAAVAEGASGYAESRAATLLSLHPSRVEMLIGTRFGDVPQVHRVTMPGGDRRQLTFFPDRVHDAAYPPDPARAGLFVFSKDTGGGEFFQLYRYDEADGRVTLLTDGKSRNVLGPWARDGRWLAYTSTRRNGKDTDLYVIDPRQPASDRRVAEVKGGGWQPLDASPDGKRLLVQEYVSITQSHLWLFDVATGSRERLTDGNEGDKVSYEGGLFAPDGKGVYTATDRDGEFRRLTYVALASKQARSLTSHIPWDIEAFDLAERGGLLAFVANEDGRGVLHLLDARTGRERTRPRLPEGSVQSVRIHRDGHTVVVALSSARSPSDVFTLDARNGRVARWTHSEVGPIDASAFREPELVRWPSFDGRVISGWLYRPPARFGGKRPVMINIHGGPESQARPGFLARNNYYVDQLGVAMLYPNVRGSSGYGKSFVKLDDGERREDSVKDIGALLDWIAKHPELDADRVLVMGGSYGGYMSYAVSARYADRLRASVSVVGISNFVSFLERTEAYRRDLRRAEYGDERDPKMRAFLQKISPLASVGRIGKPIFVVQGANDPRVPLAEAEQIVARLKKQGTPVWYLVAKDEGHGFAKKKNADFQFYATVAFIQRHLLAPVASTSP